MKPSKYTSIIIFITVTIVATIGLQTYWNLKNYEENKRSLINEVQIAFDNSIEYYYVEDTKNDYLAFIDQDSTVNSTSFLEKVKLDTVFRKKKNNKIKRINVNKYAGKSQPQLKNHDTTYVASVEFTDIPDDIKDYKFAHGISDTVKKSLSDRMLTHGKPTIKIGGINSSKISSLKVLRGKKSVDSLSNIKDLANRIMISMVRDSIEFKKLGKALNRELSRKNITISYAIEHYKSDKLFDKFSSTLKLPLTLQTYSKSTYLPQSQKLKLTFSDPTVLILKRSMTEIILSLLLSLSIIACLLYLLKTINRQKKIDEIKNDLISNITHEFKTPITTISTAIEGIRNFNNDNDTAKTDRYLNISSQQLQKLQIMVEKLLETASLDTDKLFLNKEEVDLVELLKTNVEKHQLICPDKTISFISDNEKSNVSADFFHFENAVSNLIDNAVKYGGDKIQVTLLSPNLIIISDNGPGIEKSQREKIFDQFYRIPKGNIHDVKGFGIGLYYSRKIIEKHGGTLELIPNSKTTAFKISLPHE